MTAPRDSLRDLLGSHLERAEAESEADRKARAMMERPALRERVDAIQDAIAEDVPKDAEPSERAEHLVLEAPMAAAPRRDTARRVAIDPRIDPRLLATEVQPRPTQARGMRLAVAALVVGVLIIAAWFLHRGDPPAEPDLRVAPTVAPPAPRSTAEPVPMPSVAPAPPPDTVDVPTSAAPTGPGQPASGASPKPSAPRVAPSTKPVPSGPRPLGGNGPAF